MYLGQTKMNYDKASRVLQLEHDTLTTHAAVFGSTGSGKTGLLLGMVEELHDANIPVILIDIKGDMVNVALQKTGTIKVRCLTPGGTHGEAVNVLAALKDETKASKVVSSLLSMIGENSDPIQSTAHAYLCEILDWMEIVSLEGLVYSCLNPGFTHLGALSLDDAFPTKARANLARKLNTLLVSPTFQAWRRGLDLNIDDLIESKGIVVYSVAHLQSADEQSFAISFLLNELLRWTKNQSGSEKLRLVVGIDECVGLLPPVANPPTKEPIMLLLKQARAFGVGLILATQNPVDIDYKAMSNCNTWLIGKLATDRDRSRVRAGAVSAGAGDQGDLEYNMQTLQKREFILSRNNVCVPFATKDVGCELRGPMVPTEIEDLYKEGTLTYDSDESAECAHRARLGVDTPEEDEVIEEAIDQKIEEEFLLEERTENMSDRPSVIQVVREIGVQRTVIGLALLSVAGWSVVQVFNVAVGYFSELF
jgi:hypothetical protein